MRADRAGVHRVPTGVLALAGVAALLLASAPPPTFADAPATFCHYAGLQTGSLRLAPPGQLVASLGVEYLPDITNDLAGVRGELLRIPTVGLRLGLSDNAEFQVTWPAYNRLHVYSQQQPPPLGRKLSGVTTDFGDVTAATILQLFTDHGRWPDCGLKFAARLPNSNEKKGIGDNTTDVFASILASRAIGSRVALSTDLGLGILSARTSVFTQNDVFTYGLMTEWHAAEAVYAVGEVAGWKSTHLVGPGTESRSELRAGLEVGRGALHWTALMVRSLTNWDSRGIGVSVNASTTFTVLKHAPGAVTTAQ